MCMIYSQGTSALYKPSQYRRALFARGGSVRHCMRIDSEYGYVEIDNEDSMWKKLLRLLGAKTKR